MLTFVLMVQFLTEALVNKAELLAPGAAPPCQFAPVFQLLSLPNPILSRDRWASVMRTVSDRLLTPVGLRSLAPGDLDFKPRYYATCAPATLRIIKAPSGLGWWGPSSMRG